jgi:hypothetical protein
MPTDASERTFAERPVPPTFHLNVAVPIGATQEVKDDHD